MIAGQTRTDRRLEVLLLGNAMSSDYLGNPPVRKELARIQDLARSARDARKPGRVGSLDRFFWLTAYQEANQVRFVPSAARIKNAEQGYWICNLVLKGGGTLGLAHAGFVAGIEHAGIRFAGLAGASAGSIVTLGIAAARGSDLLRPSTEGIVEAIASAPLDWFIDGPRPIRMLIKHFLLDRSPISPRIWIGALFAWRKLLQTRGLNYGDVFERWLEDEMTRLGAPTLLALENHLESIYATLERAEDDLKPLFAPATPNLRLLRSPQSNRPAQEQAKDLLRIIASALPIGMKFELPRQMKYLRHNPAGLSPAKLARMSMAIPAFFEPVRMQVNPTQWKQAPFLRHLAELSSAETGRAFEELTELTFIDGGVFANLPSDSFTDTLPDLPTILVPLVGIGKPDRFQRSNRTTSLVEDALACVNAMRLQRDVDAYLKLRRSLAGSGSTSQQNRLPHTAGVAPAPINTGDADWLNFVMSEGEKLELFLAGVKAAYEFLRGIQDDTQTTANHRREVPKARRRTAIA